MMSQRFARIAFLNGVYTYTSRGGGEIMETRSPRYHRLSRSARFGARYHRPWSRFIF